MDFDGHDEPEEAICLSTHDPTVTTTGNIAGNVAGIADPGGGARYQKTSSGARYRECLKNHAVSIGGHAVDGCGEFLPAGGDALRCAACNCHRNFHRKELEGGEALFPYYRSPVGYLTHHRHHRPVPLALPSTSGGGRSREELDDVSNPMGFGPGGPGSPPGPSSSGKKRFRTKFTQEQKDKMLVFAEGVGWRIQKHDEGAVQQFCNEVSVKRHVLKNDLESAPQACSNLKCGIHAVLFLERCDVFDLKVVELIIDWELKSGARKRITKNV